MTTNNWTPIREDLAWAAGLFDGEGYSGVQLVSRARRTTPERNIHVTITQREREVLDKFQEAVGVGRVYTTTNRGKVLYCFDTGKFEHVQHILAVLWPWLCIHKKVQAMTTLTMWAAT